MVVAEITCCVAVLLMFVLWKLTDRGVKGVPGPPGWPLIGSILDLWVPVEDIVSTLVKMLNVYPNEPVVKLKFLHLVYYGLLKGSAIEVVLKDPQQTNKADAYDLAKDYLREGLLTSRKEKWEKRRKIINPSFHVRILEGFITTFNEKSQVLVSKLEKFVCAGPFDVYPLVTLCSLDIICETMMGYVLNSQDNSEVECVKSLQGLEAGFQTRMFRPWLRSKFLYSFTKVCDVERKSLKNMVAFTTQISDFLEHKIMGHPGQAPSWIRNKENKMAAQKQTNVVSHQKPEDMKFLVAPVLESVHARCSNITSIELTKKSVVFKLVRSFGNLFQSTLVLQRVKLDTEGSTRLSLVLKPRTGSATQQLFCSPDIKVILGYRPNSMVA